MTTLVRLQVSWPAYPLRLLLKAYASPIETAAAAWREWNKTALLDKSNWAETRLMAAVAERVEELDPASPIRPRIEGIRRYVWARNQMRIKAILPTFDALLAKGIPLMLLKGGARIAADGKAAASRFLRDIDVLVPRNRVGEATDVLLDAGFRPLLGALPGSVRAAAFVRDDKGAEESSARAEIDLHWSALRFGRIADHDDRLWSRARSVTFLGRSVFVPSAADQLVIAFAHGVVADIDRPCDWVVDATQILKDQSLDWRVVADEAKARRLELAVASGLALLGDELGLEVPAFVRETLSGALRSRIFLAEFVSEATDRNSRTPSQRVISALAERLRSRGLRQTRPPEMPKVTMLPSSASRSDRDRTPLQLSASQPISGEPSLSTLLFDFDVEEGGQRYDFDVFVDGRWVARIKLRGRRWLPGRSLFRLVKVLVPSRWQRRTFNTLKLVALDSAHNPQPIAGVRASLLHR